MLKKWMVLIALSVSLVGLGVHDAIAIDVVNKYGSGGTGRAGAGLNIKKSGEHNGTAMYEEVVTDMEVKVMGGMVGISRQWKEAESDHWTFNPNWLDLELGTEEIKRNNYVYKQVSPGSNVYAYQERRTITKSISGYRWTDRTGNWIDYDHDGKALKYGDRNNVTVSFNRDLEGRIYQVLDHFNKVVLTLTYLEGAKVASVTDYTGRKVTYAYTNGRLTSVTDVRGYDWQYSYAAVLDKRVLASRTDPRGHVTRFVHVVSKGGPVCVASSGGSWVFDEGRNRWEQQGGTCSKVMIVPPSAYFQGISDELGIVTKINYFFDAPTKTYYNTKLSNGRRVTRRFNLRGEVTRKEINGELQSKVDISSDRRRRVITDRNGKQTIHEYDEYENRTRVTYPDKTSEQWTYNRYSDVVSYTNENGVKLKNDYDANGNLIRKTEAVGLPEQRVTEYEYDALGNLIVLRRVGDANTAEAVTQWTSYDNYGNPLTQVDPEGVQLQYTYGVLGNPLKLVDGRGNSAVRTYDSAGNLLAEADPLSNFTRYTYDGVGNLLTVTNALDIVVQSYSYNARNNITSSKDAYGNIKTFTYTGSSLTSVREKNGSETTITYEKHGRPHKLTDPAGDIIELFYNSGEADTAVNASFHQVSGIKYPSFTERYNYDERNRLTSVVRILDGLQQQVARYRYDAVGNLIEATDKGGKTSTRSYDAFNRRIVFRNPDEGSVFYTYDDRDNLLEVINELNISVRRFTYDRKNQLLTETWPTGTAFAFTYDASGNVVQIIDGKGQLQRGSYDAANRLTSEDHYPSLSATTPLKTVSYSYNKVGSMIGFDDGKFSGAYTFDALQRLLTETVSYGAFSRSHSYTYTATGKKASFTNPDSTQNSYLYNKADRLSSVSIPGQGSITINAYNWTAPAKITFPSGNTQENTYDASMRISQINIRDPAGNILMDYGYQYDASGNIKTKSTEHGIYTYSYDNLDRLVSAITPTLASEAYSYDATGNRKTALETADALWQYNDSNQLLQAGSNRSYSYDANGSMTARTINGISETFVYDLENRLSEVRDAQNTLIARYQYDPFGRRLAKTVNGETVYFHYADEGLVAEYDASGVPIQTYGYKPNSMWGTNPTYTKLGSQVHYYANDHLGTPQKLFRSDGAVGWSGVVSMFGNDSDSVAGLSNPLRFPGQYLDQETRLHNNYFRDYDASIGRYIQSDPVGLAGGINTYVYVRSNPVMSRDPFGLSPEDVERIIQTANEVTERMTRDGKRTFSFLNNRRRNWDHYWTGEWQKYDSNKFGHYYYCHEQAREVTEILRDINDNNGFDDHWDFDTVDNFDDDGNYSHTWGRGISENPDDPTVYFDPFYNKASTSECECENRYKCGECQL